MHTRWIETEFDNTIPPYEGSVDAEEAEGERQTVIVEVGGKRIEVTLPAALSVGAAPAGGGTKRPTKRAKKSSGGAASGDSLTAPMQGTIVKVAVEEGQSVEAGELIVVLEAMKMEQPLNAHKAGTVTGLNAEIGATVPTGTVLCEIKD